jgi:hypothetical protein
MAALDPTLYSIQAEEELTNFSPVAWITQFPANAANDRSFAKWIQTIFWGRQPRLIEA